MNQHRAKGSTVLDNNNAAKDLLESYEEINVDISRSDESCICFNLYEHEFYLLCPSLDDPTSKAQILISNDSQFDFPHIMLREITIRHTSILPIGNYRYVCLHEGDALVVSLLTYEEKITEEIERLIELMSLSPVEIEIEYQKEFLYYWNQVAYDTNIELYLGNTHSFSKLNVYSQEKEYRYISQGVDLSDIDKRIKNDRVWKRRSDISAFFVPIIDCRGILPPTNSHRWGIAEIKEVLCGKRISHISCETYEQLKSQVTCYNIVDLVFSMNCNSLPITFAARITCKDSKGKPLLQKILEDSSSVKELYTKRQDYYYINECIGNQSFVDNKNILLAGVGSLGSYVACEIVKNGFNRITVYDGDKLNPENIMRWANGGTYKGFNKAIVIKSLLEHFHPEIHVSSNAKHLDVSDLIDQADHFDYIVFTVGSSDVQMKMNRALKKSGCKAHTIFAWLEAGGTHSHILYINYANQGCFECLFTDSDGQLINNKANALTEDISTDHMFIRNGCGGTRAAYGTSVVLRTVAALLELINKIENHKLENNCLIDITPECVDYKYDAFVEKECRCCGNKAK